MSNIIVNFENQNPIYLQIAETNGADGASFIWRGSWVDGDGYIPNECVEFNGSSYICEVATNSFPPTNIAYWKLLAVKGAKGDKGDTGDKGDKGDTGTNGINGIDGNDGKSLIWRGDWVSNIGYMINECVAYLGSSYISITDHNYSEVPTELINWKLLCKKGDKGNTGDKGDKGDAGEPGTTDYNNLNNLPDLDVYATTSDLDSVVTYIDESIATRVPNTIIGSANGLATLNELQQLTASQIPTQLQNTFGSNTGDETPMTILYKLGISSISGTNTGDQDLSGKADLVGGKIIASQLPSYVDDVLEGTYVSSSTFNDSNGSPYSPESGKIYIDLTSGKTFRWSGSIYSEISASIALGETASTAYRGDRGKIAYDHSQIINNNPHNVTKNDIGLGNVDNTSDIDKPISNSTQSALTQKQDYILPGTTSQWYRGDKVFQTIDKTTIGLSNVDNTSDANKPISTAQATVNNIIASTILEQRDTGFVAFDTPSGDCHSISGTVFNLLKGGYGRILGSKVTFAGSQSVNFPATYGITYAKINSSGVLVTGSTVDPTIEFPLFYLFTGVSGTRYVAVENHPYSFDSEVSRYLHDVIGVVIVGSGGNVSIGATTGHVSITGDAKLLDHGIISEIIGTGTSGAMWIQDYKNTSGQWALNTLSQVISPSYNNSGTVTALTSGRFGVYRLYATKHDGNTTTARYIAIMDSQQYVNQNAAQSSINANTVSSADGALLDAEIAQIGFCIVNSSGVIVSTTVSKQTLTTQSVATSSSTAAGTSVIPFENFTSLNLQDLAQEMCSKSSMDYKVRRCCPDLTVMYSMPTLPTGVTGLAVSSGTITYVNGSHGVDLNSSATANSGYTISVNRQYNLNQLNTSHMTFSMPSVTGRVLKHGLAGSGSGATALGAYFYIVDGTVNCVTRSSLGVQSQTMGTTLVSGNKYELKIKYSETAVIFELYSEAGALLSTITNTQYLITTSEPQNFILCAAVYPTGGVNTLLRLYTNCILYNPMNIGATN